VLAALKQIVMFVPNIVRLTIALAADGRVPARTKVLLAAAAAYFISPVDLIPDWIPVLGQLDDAVLAMIVIDTILNYVDPELVCEHWRGSPRALAIGGRVAGVVCFFVPKWLKRRFFSVPAAKAKCAEEAPPKG